jgi:hypothetical protein
VVGKDHGRAVLPKRPQPHQDQPRPDTVGRGRHVDAGEAGQRTVTKRGRDVTERGIDGPEGATGGHDEERQRDERLGDHEADHGLGEPLSRQLPEERVGTNDVNQQDPADQRRHRQRELDDHADHRAQPPSPAGQEIGQRDTGQHPNHHRDRGALDRHPQRRPEPRDVPPFIAPGCDAVDERSDRVRQVENQQGAEPAKRLRHPAGGHVSATSGSWPGRSAHPTR